MLPLSPSLTREKLEQQLLGSGFIVLATAARSSTAARYMSVECLTATTIQMTSTECACILCHEVLLEEGRRFCCKAPKLLFQTCTLVHFRVLTGFAALCNLDYGYANIFSLHAQTQKNLYVSRDTTGILCSNFRRPVLGAVIIAEVI